MKKSRTTNKSVRAPCLLSAVAFMHIFMHQYRQELLTERTIDCNLLLNSHRHTTSCSTKQSRLDRRSVQHHSWVVAGQKPHQSWIGKDILKRVYLFISGLNANVRGESHSVCHFILSTSCDKYEVC